MATSDAVDKRSVLEGDEYSDRAHDEVIDPWCDLCFDETNKKVEASGFCSDCNTFLCKSFLNTHKMLPCMENHRILQGGRMPKTQADRPAKYLDCDIHRGKAKDHFCMDHSKMTCSQCITEFHMACRQKLIPDLCTYLGRINLQDLRDETETIKKLINPVKINMEQNIDSTESRKHEMIKEAKQLRDKLIFKIQITYMNTVSDINTACEKEVSHLSNQVSALSDMISSLDQTLSKIDKIIDIEITPHVFIQLQNMAENVRQSQTELADLEKRLCKVDLSFSASPEISAFLSANQALGIVKEDSSQLDLMMATPGIVFPSSPRKSKPVARARRTVTDIKQIEVTKLSPLNVKMIDDKHNCYIKGMAITGRSVLLIADWNNMKVKAVSPDHKLLSCLALSGQPYDISAIDDRTAAVSTDDKKLHIVDISNLGSLAIQRSVSLQYKASSVVPCNNNLVVVKWTEPKCVKMISMTGAEKWTVSTDQNGQQLFEKPFSVTTSTVNDKMIIIVSDWGKDTLTLLDANNGDVIKMVDVNGTVPHGLSADNDGNVYVCCARAGEVCVWSGDLSRNRILLSRRDLQPNLVDIVYDHNTDEIFICYYTLDTVDRFKFVIN